MKKILTISTVVLLSTSIYANTDVQAQIDALSKEIQVLKKDQKSTKKTLTAVKKHDAMDNLKLGVEFRNAVDVIDYKYNNYTIPAYKNSAGNLVPAKDISGTKASNHSLLTSRLYINMAAAPLENLSFKGKLAVYSTWGSEIYVEDTGLKDWSVSSKAGDTVVRIKEAYFVYSSEIGSQPISFSIGRRPATKGFLGNMRQNEKAGSPLAHITNMEVNAIMTKLDWDRFIPGAYTKLVYGRAHTGEMEGVYSAGGGIAYGPFADLDNEEDENVDFFVVPGAAYADGQYTLMYQWAHIFNTKGRSSDGTIKAASGNADLFALSLKVDGIGDEINDFLDETTLFISGAMTLYNPSENHTIFGQSGQTDGSSIWIGALIPDGFTDAGRFGIEYNHGSRYWTPMTWAEDTALGSKIAVRGDAYEAYWNFNLFGVKNLPSQVRYTYLQHDYTPNIKCAGWVPSNKVDIVASDLRFEITYKY